MNFQTILEELDRLYEAKNDEQEAQVEEQEYVEEQNDDEVLEIVDDEETTTETEEEPVEQQQVLECTNCGALVIKNATDVKIDDETGLANIEEECEFCDEADGYKVIGTFTPSADEEITESMLTEGKFMDNLKKVVTRVGADAATIMRCFAELAGGSKLLDAAEHIENKAVLKALMSGNERVMNTLTKDDIEELQQDIEKYEKEKKDPTLYDIWCEDEEGKFKTYEGITEKEANAEIEQAFKDHDGENFNCWMVKHGDPADKIQEGIFDMFKKKKNEPLRPCAPKLLDDQYKYDFVVVTHNSKDFSDPQYVGIYMDRAFDSMDEAEEAMNKLRKNNSYYNSSNSKVMTVSQAIKQNFIRK